MDHGVPFPPPSDEELIRSFLVAKSNGQQLPDNPITEVDDLYYHHPETLTDRYGTESVVLHGEVPIFLDSPQCSSFRKQWILVIDTVFGTGEVLGFRTDFNYHKGKYPTSEEKTGWTLHEFKNKDLNKEIALCRIHFIPLAEEDDQVAPPAN